MSHNSLCMATNGGFLYECHCDDPEYLEEISKNSGIKYS